MPRIGSGAASVMCGDLRIQRRQPLRRAVKSGRQDLNQRPHGLEPDGLRRTEMTQVVTEIMLQILGPAVGSFRFWHGLAGIFTIYRHCSATAEVDTWTRHFRWEGPYLVGKTSVGRTTIVVLAMNHPDAVAVRQSFDRRGAFSAQGVRGRRSGHTRFSVLGFLRAPRLSPLALLWVAAPASRDPARVLFQRGEQGLVTQWPAGMLVGAEGSVSLPGHPGQSGAGRGPVGAKAQPAPRVVPCARVCHGAAPGRATRSAHRSRANRVVFHMSRGGQRVPRSSSANEAKRPCQRCPRQPSRKLTKRV